MELSIIIVNWNSKDLLRKCIGSIILHPPEVAYEVIVVDGGSFDGCGEMLGKEFPSVRFIQSAENVGFARANNLGVSHSHGHCLLFLNPDTEVTTGAITKLLLAHRSCPNPGVIGARLLNSDGSLQRSCVKGFPTIASELLASDVLQTKFPHWRIWGMTPLFEAGEDPKRAQAISGACMLIDRRLFDSVGQFSTDYFMYSEDVELCFRTVRAGRQNYYVPAASIHHHAGGCSKTEPSTFSAVMMRQSRLTYFRKTKGKFYSVLYRVLMLPCAVFRAVTAFLMQILSLGRHGSAAFKKWRAIALWSLWLKQARPSRQGGSTA